MIVQHLSGKVTVVSHIGGPDRVTGVLQFWMGGKCTFFWKGEKLDPDRTFRSYEIRDRSTVQVVFHN